jgi:hypothetical protein
MMTFMTRSARFFCSRTIDQQNISSDNNKKIKQSPLRLMKDQETNKEEEEFIFAYLAHRDNK